MLSPGCEGELQRRLQPDDIVDFTEQTADGERNLRQLDEKGVSSLEPQNNLVEIHEASKLDAESSFTSSKAQVYLAIAGSAVGGFLVALLGILLV